MKKSSLFMKGMLCLCLSGQTAVCCAQLLAAGHSQERISPFAQAPQSIEKILKELETKHSIFFMYQSDKIRKIETRYEEVPGEKVEQTLDRVLKANGLEYRKHGKIYAIFPKNTGSRSLRQLKRELNDLHIPESTFPLQSSSKPGALSAKLVPDRTIKGRVQSVEDNEGLPGVSILVKGTSQGTTSDAQGNFTIDVPGPAAVLVLSYVGYISQEIVVGNRSSLEVRLVADNKSLEEVVVVGYGTVRKSDLTGAVSKINAEGINERPVSSVEQFLQGQVSGVQITQNTGAPGGGISFNIRGATSVSGSNQPLIVIDGYPVDSDNGGTKMSGGSQSGYLGQLPNDNALANLNPGDIESIEILKDASATAIYGSRASNGVVLITTKRGRPGQDRISYNFRFDMSELPRKIDVLNTADYLTYMNETRLNSGADSLYKASQLATLAGTNTNWQDLIYRKAYTRSHQLNISGGLDKMRYSVSVGYLGQEGIIKNSRFDRGSLRINLDREFSKKLKIGVNMSGVLGKNKAAMQSSNIADASMSVVRGALTSRPFDSPFTSEDELEVDQTQVGNPLTLVTLADDVNRTTTVLANMFAEYTVTNGLTFKVNGGVNINSSHRDFYHPRGTTLGNLEGGYAYRGHGNGFNYLTEYTLNYNKVLNEKHSINAVGGYTWQEWTRRDFSINVLNFPNDNLLYYDLSAGSSITNPASATTRWALSSFLGRLVYAFDKRYLVTFTGRTDGSTRLAEGNKWDFFPSLALGWNLHNESFMQPLTFISEFKIRASYGLSGNQAVSVGSTKARLSATGSVANQSIQIGYALANLPNSNLHWETTRQTNIGADVSLFGNRLTVGFDYYRKRTDDLLIALTIPPSNGFSSYSTNQGVIQNQGYEFDVKAKVLTTGLLWDVSGNISLNRNKVLSLGPGLDYFVGPAFGAVAGQSLTIAKVGYPIGSFYGYRIGGIYQNQQQIDAAPVDSYVPLPGSFIFRDLSGPGGVPDGQISIEDREIIGNPYPDFFFGLTNNLEWKGLALSVFVQGSIGQDVVNANRYQLDGLSGAPSNVSREAYNNRWTGENTSNYYPQAYNLDPFRSRFTDFIVEDASYIRLKNITLSYQLPARAIRFIRTIKLFASAGNLLTWTKYKGYDPEINSKGDNSMMPGIDSGSIPQYRTFSLGINAGF